MKCPYCHQADTRVVDSRPSEAGAAIRRRRECAACGSRFSTYERPALSIVVVKRDGIRQPFDETKLRRGVERALADRPVPAGDVDELVEQVHGFARSAGGEVSADELGRQVLAGLRRIDEVGYLRFASVYKDFQEASDFEKEMAVLEDRT